MSSDIVRLLFTNYRVSVCYTHQEEKKPHNFKKLKLAIYAMSISKVKSTKSHIS